MDTGLDPKYDVEKLQNPKSEAEILAALDSDIKSGEWILAPLHRQWYESIFWFAGEQYLEYSPRTRRFQVRPAKQHMPRSVTNYILPHVETGVAMLSEALPAPKVVSETKNDADRTAADVAQGIIRYKDEAIGFEQKKHDSCVWTVVTGQVYLQAIMDVANKEKIRIPLMKAVQEPVIDETTGQPLRGPGGEVMLVQKETQATDATGEPAFDEIIMADEGVEVLSPFEIIPDWTARYPWEMRRYTHFRARSREWIGRVYGSAAKKKVKPEQGLGLLSYYQLKVLDILTRSTSTGRLGLPTASGGSVSDWRFMEDAVIVKSRYMLPTDDYQEGRLMTVASGEILDDSDYPYGDRLNLFTLRWTVIPGSTFGMGMVRNLIMPQKRLNGIDTQIDLIRKTMGNPQWLVPKGSQFTPDLATSEPGHKHVYSHKGGKPAPIRLEAMNAPADAHHQRDAIIQDFDNISGMMNVLRGDKPPGIEAGIALEALSEQAGKRFNPTLADNRAELKRLYLMRLQIAQQSNAWAAPRAIPMVGEDGSRDMKEFQATDFKGNITITIDAVPMVALSQAIKLQKFTQGVELGLVDLVNSPVNREKARSLLNLSEFEEEFSLDYKRAQMENEKLRAGEQVARQMYDDDMVHFMVVMQLVKSRDFDTLPEDVRQNAMAHAAVHGAAVDLMLKERAAQQQATAGEGGKAAAPAPASPPEAAGADQVM